MSVAGQLIISIQRLSGLPSSVRNAVMLVRVLSRKERRVPRAPETITNVATVSEDGTASFTAEDSKIEVYSPFPHEDVLRIHVAPGPHDDAFGAAPLIRVSVIVKSKHIEKDFTLTHPKTKEACGTLRLSIDYVPPSVQLSEDAIAEKLRSAAAPGKTMTYSQALSLFESHGDNDSDIPPEPPTEPAPEVDEKKEGDEAHKSDSKKNKKSHLHRSKKDKSKSKENASDSSDTDSGSSGSVSNKSSKSNGSRPTSMPGVSADELAAAMAAENDNPPSSSSSSVGINGPILSVSKAVSETCDIMLDQAPKRAQRELLKNVVSPRPRNGSGSLKSIEKNKSAKGVSTHEVPISITPCEKLTFGLNSRQASLETDLIQPLTVENKSSKAACFRFLLRNSDHPKYTLSVDTEMGKLKAGQKIEVILKLVLHCTTNLRLALQVVVWKGHLKEYDTAVTDTITLNAGVQSKLSTKLDSEEVEIFRPPIGSGAFGTVYRGKYRGFEVAVKVLKDQENSSPELIEAFETEVEMAEALRHTSIVNFVGAVHFPGQLALVTEFCPFGDLNSALKKYPFPYPLKLKALLDASRAMDYLHQSGMIHRDLKTENLLVVSLEAMSQTVCKLSDFGTARGLNSFVQAKSLQLTKGVGTPIFMAPEVLTGSQTYAEAADVYSFGVMMCHVANNELPYTRDRRFESSYQFVQKVIAGMRPELKVDMPSDYKKLMTACWDQDQESRPAFCDISDMLEDMFFAARKTLPSASILRH